MLSYDSTSLVEATKIQNELRHSVSLKTENASIMSIAGVIYRTIRIPM